MCECPTARAPSCIPALHPGHPMVPGCFKTSSLLMYTAFLVGTGVPKCLQGKRGGETPGMVTLVRSAVGLGSHGFEAIPLHMASSLYIAL